MTPALLPHDESGRLHTLHQLQVQDPDEAEDAFNAIARLLHSQSECPIALVGFVDADTLWLKGGIGCSARQVPRGDTFCELTILTPDILEIPDCSTDSRFADNPWVTGESHIRFYAGAPVAVRGHRIGTVCILDREPRLLTTVVRQALSDLATVTSSLMESRLQARDPNGLPAAVAAQTKAPVPAERATAPAPPDDSGAMALDGGLRMLYVEDNRISAILFEEMLRTHNSDVNLRIAESGAEALTIVQTWDPEVLVLDAHLPDASGFELLQMLRALPRMANVPAYMCSADAQPEDVQHAYEAGFIGYWTKPINIATVLTDIRQWTELHRRHSPASA